MTQQPKRYTLDDDKLIKDKVELALSEGRILDPVFEEVGEELERSASAIEFRFYNVIKKRVESETQLESETELQEEFKFVPYEGETKRRGSRAGISMKQYTPEDDERIWAAIQVADEAGIPMSPVWTKLAEDLERTPKAIEVRCALLRKRHREDTEIEDDSDDDDDDNKGIYSKLKTLVKERDYYKKKYDESEDKLKDYDHMARELRKIRKLLE